MIGNIKQLSLKKWDSWTTIKIFCFLFIFIFLIYPLFSLFKGSFLDIETQKFTFANYIRLFSRESYFRAFKNSFIITTVTAAGTLVLGVAQAYIMTRFVIKGHTLLKVLTIVSLLSPPFIGAYSWILLLGNNGAIRLFLEKFGLAIPSIYSMTGILFVFIFKLFPYIYLYTSGALKSIDASLSEAAEGLGSSKLKIIFKVTLPLMLPSLFSASLLVSMTALADFGTPLLLGRGISTLPVLIYDEFVTEMGGNSYFASSIAVIVVLIATILFLVQHYIISKKSFEMNTMRSVEAKQLKGGKNIFAHLYCYILVGVASLPQFTVAFYSFKKTQGPIFKDGFSFDSYRRVFGRLSNEIINTFTYSLVALVIMVILALFIAYLSVRRRNTSTTILDTFVMLPYIIPGTVIGIMYALTFNSGPIVITGTSFILIIAYVIRRGPNVIRSSSSILEQISPSVEEASVSLGVSPLRSFLKITAVLMVPGIVSGGLLAWIRTTSELSVSIMLYIGKTRTMPVATYSEIIYGRYGAAAALSTLLVAIIAVVLIVFFHVTRKSNASF